MDEFNPYGDDWPTEIEKELYAQHESMEEAIFDHEWALNQQLDFYNKEIEAR